MERPENYIGHHEEDAPSPDDSESLSLVDDNGEVDWMSIARDAYETSTDYFDANIRTQLEKNVAMFMSRHPAGSKYHQEGYKFRSKIFRPKTRSTIRRHEAAASMAFFSTSDVVACEAEDKNSPIDVGAAQFAKNLLSYRLEHSIDTFLSVIGAYQDAMTNGAVVSRQEWIYETKEVKTEVTVIDPETGEEVTETQTSTKLVTDKPDVKPIPIENFRFDPACDWRDPVGTSPYLIELIPMYAYKVKERMKGVNLKTNEEPWYQYSDGEISSARQTGGDDTIRAAREGKREDSHDQNHLHSLYDIVWVHRNIVNVNGDDWIYYTLGTEKLLSDPIPLEEAFLHGRPYAVGTVNIETHKAYPAGLPQLGQDLQVEANDIANQRLDNIKLILNKRYHAIRGTDVDWRALKSSAPGGIVLMDKHTDVKEESFSDVTGSSYAEQDRVNVDFDELMGAFSNSSVQTNRSMNETVGGMSIAKDDSNTVTEYQLRVFVETWFERVLKQLLEMERHYETDQRILKIAGEGNDPNVVAMLLQGDIKTRVGVGFGATAPHKRIEKMALGLDTVARYMPHKLQQLDDAEIVKEVFGALGFRDGSRFFKDDQDVDPQVQQMQQEMQKLQQIIQTKQVEQQGKVQIEQLRQQGAIQRDQMKLGTQQQMEQLKSQLNYIQQQIAAEGNDIRRGELQLQEKALLWKMKGEEINMLVGERDRLERQLQENRAQQTQSTVDGDGLVDDRGSTVMANDNYGLVPQAEY